MILNEDGLRLLKSLADSEDLKIKRAVCNAFANLCSDGKECSSPTLACSDG